MLQKRKSCMLHHSHHSSNRKPLQRCNLKHQWCCNRAGTWKHRRCFLNIPWAQERQIRNRHAERMYGIRKLWGPERKKKLLAALYGQICTAGMCFLSVGSRTLLFREARSWFVFLWEQAGPPPFKRQGIREVLEDAAASTNSLLVLIGCLNKHQHPDTAELPAVN